jgi:uncharacterized cofD-like protein
MTEQRPSVVVLGGGTGTFMMLTALKRLPVDLTAILTMVDDGGSNKVLRDQFGLLPTSGIRQAVVALSDDESLLRELFNYRFHQGEGIRGMTFGNLFLAALTDIVGSQKQAIEETQKLLRVRGKIFPISYDDVRLVATYEDGSEAVGEHLIDEPTHTDPKRIVSLRTEPPAKLSAEAQQAIEQADFVIIGPGDFFTNTVANFVVAGLPEALKRSQAKKIFVGNLMTKFGETPGFALTDFLAEIDRYYGLDGLDFAVVNNNQAYPAEALALYAREKAVPVRDDVEGEQYQGVKIIRGDLLADQVFGPAKGDSVARSILRHDAEKFARLFSERFLAGV